MSPQMRRVLSMWGWPTLLWAVLVSLVAATFAAAYSPLGAPIKAAIHLAVMAAQVTLIGVFFMNLRRSRALLWFAAAAGLYWLIIMFVLTFNDYVSRGPSSPCDEPAFSGAVVSQCDSFVK
jgi:cytochrome c oxidase subunit IV